jgi:ATP-dependent exoDNAse (exonuclease V) alpha subunit
MMKLAPKHKHRLILKAHPKVVQSQDTIVYKGLPLIAMATRMGLGFCNADEFTVVSFDTKEVVLRYEEDDSDAEEKLITIPASELTHLFAPSYAISCHRAQGSSISEPFGIFDWEHMDDKLKYVALSRSRKLKYINMCSKAAIQIKPKVKDEEEREL